MNENELTKIKLRKLPIDALELIIDCCGSLPDSDYTPNIITIEKLAIEEFAKRTPHFAASDQYVTEAEYRASRARDDEYLSEYLRNMGFGGKP